MAKSRMISTAVVRSIKFQNMSAGAQALYLQCVADADDMGVAEVKRVLSYCPKVRKPSYDELINSSFVTVLDEDDGIIYINDFHSVNSFAKHGATPSIYMDLLLSNCCTKKLIKSVKTKDSGNPMLGDAMLGETMREQAICNAERFRQVASNSSAIAHFPMLYDSLMEWYEYTDERGYKNITDKSINVLIDGCVERCESVGDYEVCEYISNAVASGYNSINWSWFDDKH